MLIIGETPEVLSEHPLGRKDFGLFPPKAPISAVIITRNEEKNIRRTLSRLYWCDEIVIVDSYSTDDTVAICREFGCRIFFQTFRGYGPQKRYAVNLASNDWVLCLDADEVLSTELIGEMRAEFRSKPRHSGYALPMNLVFLGREFQHGKESGRYFLRLFRKSRGNFNMARVHERIELTGSVGKFNHSLRHYSYDTVAHWIAKMDRYTTLSAQEALKKGKRKSILQLAFALPYYFLRYYFLERNFLNGLEGFYWSVFNSYYHFTKYTKIIEAHAPTTRLAIP
jgi:glycosyltransferase involved in cell wall biosynthesis